MIESSSMEQTAAEGGSLLRCVASHRVVNGDYILKCEQFFVLFLYVCNHIKKDNTTYEPKASPSRVNHSFIFDFIKKKCFICIINNLLENLFLT